jgi:hypothetical protein
MTVPLICWSWPSMVTLVPPGAAAALDDSDADDETEDEDELASDVADSDDDLSPDEQPDNPAIRTAAPPTATSNPVFTTVSFDQRGPSSPAGHLPYYGPL